MSHFEPIRIGMIGVGGFGAHRRKLLRETGRFELVAFADRDRATLEEACEQDGAQACGDFDALLEAPIEAVVISTGADSHAALTRRALAAGKHVFVEKPVCCNVEQAAELRSAAAASACVVGVGHNHQEQSPAWRLYRELERNGALGTLAAYEANSSHSGGLAIRPGDWRGKPESNPGGMLFQCGVHALHTLTGLFGPVESVVAMFRDDVHPDTQTPDVSSVLLRHTSGVVGTLNCYHVTAYCHELRLFGTGGNVYLDTLEGQASYQLSRRGPAEPREPLAVPPAPAGAHLLNLTEWARAIREGGEPSPSLAEGIAAVLPVFAAALAARERREVALSELTPALVQA